ncbi:MAG: DNA adenine methylase, partial [Candidatus Hodarchaeales archaeon]
MQNLLPYDSINDLMNKYPLWHFIGSKQSIWPWIVQILNIEKPSFNSVLDVFGGSGVMSLVFALLGKKVVYNEILSFLQVSQKGVLTNTKETLSEKIVHSFWENEQPNTFVQDYYTNLYFFEEEAVWIDKVIQSIWTSGLSRAQRGIAFFALCQACLEKRPFNTFQNSHLHLRLKERKKIQSWDKPLAEVFISALKSVNFFVSNLKNLNLPKIKATNFPSSIITPDVIPLEQIDLVYLDPPFLSGKKRSRRFANYVDNYHVLEALSKYYTFEEWIDVLHPLHKPREDYPPNLFMKPWLNPSKVLTELEKVIKRFQES